MKDKSTKQERFIELRAEGNSFNEIAKQIQVSKGTLIEWSKELEIELINAKALRLDFLLKKYGISKENQLERYSKQLAKINKEIDKRDLSSIPTEKLLNMQLKLLETIDRYRPEIEFGEEVSVFESEPITIKKGWRA